MGWTTVAALARGRLPARQTFRLCRVRDCEVVYYGSGGAILSSADLHVRPGFKGDDDGLFCYCFLHRRSDVGRRPHGAGWDDILATIAREIEESGCACEVRNPSGRCCLGEIRQRIGASQNETESAE